MIKESFGTTRIAILQDRHDHALAMPPGAGTQIESNGKRRPRAGLEYRTESTEACCSDFFGPPPLYNCKRTWPQSPTLHLGPASGNSL